MFRTLYQKILPNPLDTLLRSCVRQNKRSFLIEWNRGLGDIALGLYAMTYRIRQYVEGATIHFLTRKSLQEGFHFLENVETIVAPDWERKKPYDAYEALRKLQIDPAKYDVIIQKPDPTYWVKWQLGSLVPKLTWDPNYEEAYKRLPIDPTKKYIAVQPNIDTKYNLWRGYPLEKYRELFNLIETNSDAMVILVGEKQNQAFENKNILDLRGKTNLFELISLIKNCCPQVILPDSGILSFVYYLDAQYPIKVLSLWADPKQGVLKQDVFSPNAKLIHIPLIGAHRKIGLIDPYTIFRELDL